MRAVILGGTGAIGGAVAARLAAAGWAVDVTGRDALDVARTFGRVIGQLSPTSQVV